MNRISFPLKQRMTGPAVDDLHAALQVVLDRGIVLRDDENARRALSENLEEERARNTFGAGTRKLVSLFQEARGLEAGGTVDERTAGELDRVLDEQGGKEEVFEYRVQGTVRLSDGFPAAGFGVAAFDRDLRSEQALGQGRTDRRGSYLIPYSESQFARAEKANADLVVRVLAADGSVLAASPVLFNAPPAAVVDVTIPAEALLPPTLFEKIDQVLAPLLGDLNVAQLEEQPGENGESGEPGDLTFLSGETGFERKILARFVLAHRLAPLAERALPAEFWFVLLDESFYAFDETRPLGEQLADVVADLPSLDAAAVRKSLDRGFNRKDIADALREKVPAWLEAFIRYTASRAAGRPAGDEAPGQPGFVAQALDQADVGDAGKRETFARLFNAHKAFTPDLLAELGSSQTFNEKEIADLQTSFRLNELTRGDFSIVKRIRDEFGLSQPGQIRGLARKSEDDWVALVQAGQAAAGIRLPIEAADIAGQVKLPEAVVYGKMLERKFREAYPTSAFAGALERSLAGGGPQGVHQAETMSRFLAQHENFELLTTPVDAFLKNGVQPDFRVAAQDETFRLELKAVQRVFKLAPTFAATDALLADDLHSAQKIYWLGESEFVRRYASRPGFTPQSARLAWNRAAETHAAVLTIVGDFQALEAEALPLALQNGNDQLSTFPNWDSLFKAGDLCECEHCRSVLGPAAYFADLMMFLRDRDTHTGNGKVKDVLLRRRPDLGFLELDCANALTPFPYVDTVCEVLEDAVDAAGANDLELAGLNAIPADAAAAKAAVAGAFDAAFADPVNDGKEKIALGDDFTLSQVNPANADEWVVHGSAAAYRLKKKAAPHFFAEILRNTRADAAELRAYPAYVNPKAYDTLRAAKHPFALPFDLFAEETRAAFRKCNLQRWDLMRAFRGASGPGGPGEGEIAAEYFGISVDAAAAFDEKRLILETDATLAGQQAAWGETGADWLDRVGNVRNFLAKTGLEYNELLALLDLEFINLVGDIVIHHLDASCDTDKKVIQVLDAAKLDRIHRFLRLWRKLEGWRMWELDLVLRHARIGNGTLNEAFLIRLFYFSQLKERLGTKATVEQLCALFGDLNAQTRFTRLHEKREDALYQNLFLNRRLINPLDAAFQLDPVTGDLPAGEAITGHHPVVLAALGIREADLVLLEELTKASDGMRYITDDLTLGNLSFLWRHAWLARLLKFTIVEWKIVLRLFQQDIPQFADPRAAWTFVDGIDRLRSAGFTPDELDWLLAVNLVAKSAVKEADIARFLAGLRKQLQAVRAEYDPGQYAFLGVTPPTDVDSLTALLTSLLQKLNRDEEAVQFFIGTLRDEISQQRMAAGLPAGFDFPPAIKSAIRIRYDEPAGMLRFTGLMTQPERTTLLTDASLAAVTGIASYQEAIEAFFTTPRLMLKFFEPLFTAPLAALPPAVDFSALADVRLAARITYDAEQRLLRLAGILASEDKAALDALSPDPAYRNAVNSLYTQPAGGIFPPERIWLLDADLKFPLRDAAVPANDHLAENLATAAVRALDYLSATLAESAVVEQGSAQLGLTEALTRRVLTGYAVLPDTLMMHLTGPFAATSGVIDHATLKITFDGWYWASRTAAILGKWKLTLADLEKLDGLAGAAQLLDFMTLPLDDASAIAPVERLVRTSHLLRMRDSLPETAMAFLDVLEKLHQGVYAAQAAADPAMTEQERFAADVELVNEAWPAADVEALIASLDLAYPGGYLLAETWERLRRAFYFIGNLNAGADSVKAFADAAMTFSHAMTLKSLLRSRFGAETWLALSAEIQDVLRERKRDALSAYLLTTPQPADAPSGKWENGNDLYAYYLLDTEMSSCLLTSRLVQGSGSVQLLVQRCLMGLEPDVRASVDGPDGDSAWRWWKWMGKYRVWEANRKVFLWPENWIEPELKKDRSPFFKELENELLQNEVDQYSVEAAYMKYLEKLDSVAQLEIAGFYQEDDGDTAIVHVFGRTTGAEPHVYHYRRYDYRQWTPWEKVDLDIQGDYLVPAVVGRRLFLFWPVFTEIPDESGNNANVPLPASGASSAPVKKAKKSLRLQMAVSDYRQGKWTPKKISKDFYQSSAYDVEVVRKNYTFVPVDRSEIDGRFGIRHDGRSLGSDGQGQAYLSGAFEIAGCDGVPVAVADLGNFIVPAIRPETASVGNIPAFMKWAELGKHNEFGQFEPRQDNENDFTLENFLFSQLDNLKFTPILIQTPWFFRMSPPWHPSYFDRLLLDGLLGFGNQFASIERYRWTSVGSWLPFFYNDKKRTFFVLPSLFLRGRADRLTEANGSVRYYYPDIKKAFRQLEDFFEGQVRSWLNGITLPAAGTPERQQLEQFLRQAFPDPEAPSAYGDEQVKNLMLRWFMRFVHLYLGMWALYLFQFRQFHFKNFYHPFVCDFARLVYNPLKGIPALMSRATQLKDSGFSFEQAYQPTGAVAKLPPQYPALPDCHPREVVDFTPDGAYASYNWELFFHAPLLIANSLSRNQRFEEARDWYHFIFNPIGEESGLPGGSAMSKYWITKPFFETTDPQYIQQRIENILRILAGDTGVPGFSPQVKKDLEDQVHDWRTNPFEPHRIANYRTVAYQKTVVMKYLDNLIAWGDYLFRQDSMESIGEATQLYILAAEILGPRPRNIPPRAQPPVQSFNELEDEFDTFSNALVEVENLVPVMPGDGPDGADPAPLPMLYFCIPRNDRMLGYWDTVADRLYKIRHCMNIEGVVRQLALFEPPIDPGVLVKAVAGGMDIGSALADLNTPLPLYRFSILLQRATEVCNDVKALGGALLAALEKKDAEALSLLRQGQEIQLLEAVKAVREQQIEEAKENLEGVRKSRELADIRKQYYESRAFMNAGEIVAISLSGASTLIDAGIALAYVLAGGLKVVPQFLIGGAGFGGSPQAGAETGGRTFGGIAEDAALTLSSISRALEKGAGIASTVAGYERRQDEWDFQRDLAVKEIEQVDRSIAAAEMRVALAEKELENHALQIENARASDAFMRSKYTNQELYQWQTGQISGVYFQSYRLAYDLAKRAERCFRFELGLQDSSYISFGYWDSLKKGLLSGERLQYDLRRLEAAYLEQNRREFELTRHVSLALLDPLALVKLRETGRCFISLPEEIFDLDYPGHYFRRIRSVSMTLPCVAGPYTTIACTLRLLKNSIRINTANGDNGYPRNTDEEGLPADDVRFVENGVPVKAIATSSAQNDSGMFELSFRDERYLPFEGAGAISAWSLELFSDLPSNNPDPGSPDFGRPLRQFDYGTISDAILHVRYTAREDAGPFRNGAITHLRQYLAGEAEAGPAPSLRMFSLRQEFPTQWHNFLHPANPADGNTFALEMRPALFPLRDAGKTLKINTLWLLARCADSGVYTVVLDPPLPAPPPVDSNVMKLSPLGQYGGLHHAQKGDAQNPLGIEIAPFAAPVTWRLKMTNPQNGNLQQDPVTGDMEVRDVFLILGYEWE